MQSSPIDVILSVYKSGSRIDATHRRGDGPTGSHTEPLVCNNFDGRETRQNSDPLKISPSRKRGTETENENVNRRQGVSQVFGERIERFRQEFRGAFALSALTKFSPFF